MSKYLLIESRDPYQGAETQRLHDLATGLVKNGHEVTLFLVENGAFAARGDGLARLRGAGVQVLVDRFALEERGIQKSAIEAADLAVVVDELAAGTKTIWH